MSREITIDNRRYNIGTIDVFQQFHVARRIGPMVLGIIAAVQGGEDDGPESLLNLVSGPMANALAEMRQDDADYVLYECLSAVRVVEGEGNLVTLYDKARKQLRYADLKMPAMLSLVYSVLQDNLGSFFPTGQQESTPAKD